MVQASSGSFGPQLARMGDKPGDDKGLVDILLMNGDRMMARSKDVVVVESQGVIATLTDGRFAFIPAGGYVALIDHQHGDGCSHGDDD